MVIRKVKKKDIEKDEQEVFNTFIEILGTEDYEDLNEIQKKPYLCFIYEAELSYGGHAQYFERYGDEYLDETIEALEFLGAIQQVGVLKVAKRIYYSNGDNKSHTGKSASIEEDIYSACDKEYYDAEPILDELLEVYLDKYMDQFIEVV